MWATGDTLVNSAPLPGQLGPTPWSTLHHTLVNSAPHPGQLGPTPWSIRPHTLVNLAPHPGQLCPTPWSTRPHTLVNSAPLPGQLCTTPWSTLPHTLVNSAPHPGQFGPTPWSTWPHTLVNSAPHPGQLGPTPWSTRPHTLVNSAPYPGQLGPTLWSTWLPTLVNSAPHPGQLGPTVGPHPGQQLCPTPWSTLPHTLVNLAPQWAHTLVNNSAPHPGQLGPTAWSTRPHTLVISAPHPGQLGPIPWSTRPHTLVNLAPHSGQLCPTPWSTRSHTLVNSAPHPGQLGPIPWSTRPHTLVNLAPHPGQLGPTLWSTLPHTLVNLAPHPGQLGPTPWSTWPHTLVNSAPHPGQLGPIPWSTRPHTLVNSAPHPGRPGPTPWSTRPNTMIDLAWVRAGLRVRYDYILVFSPGHLLHLLNVAAEFEPCHHIVWHVVSAATNVKRGQGVPNLPSPSSDGPSLTTFLRERAGLCVYDCRQDIAYRVSVSKEGFADVFAGCYLPSTRLAIMHYAAVHHKDSSLSRLLVSKMCNDIGSPEVSSLLTEFLVGTTYNAMRRQLDMRILPLLQFTSTETGRGQLEKNEKGQQLARITYNSMRDFVQMKYSKVDKPQSDGNFWEHLRYNLQKLSIADMWPRFNTTSLQQHINAANQEAAFADDLVEGRVRSSSLLKRISDSARRAFSGSSTPRKGSLGGYAVLTFLNAAERDMEQDRVVGMTVEHLTDHLSRYLPRETRIKVLNVAREFVSCQLQQAKQLLQFIWISLGFPPDGYLTSNVGEPGRPAESELFHMTERFYMSAQELCFPLPNGFKTFFTTLGFRCLDSHVFLQYVDRGVLHFTDDFRDMVMEDLGDDRDNSEMKLNIVSRLPKRQALTGLQQWNHPISTRFLSKQYVSSLLLEGEDLGWAAQPRRVSLSDSYSTTSSQDSSEDDSVDAHVHFPPLATLMKLLQMKEPNTKRHSRSGRYVDLKFVEQSALQQTKQEYGTNLSNVSF
ncbi:GSAP [Branchiostoma lanceolatum]|uniref:GSAP protein n=1 Tax=Branchiostoma lanceolatum TaxID=7740 RepID=A0A8J9ZXA4_BRALA|nr:GSAP [Branchiostoma lanceolatum]